MLTASGNLFCCCRQWLANKKCFPPKVLWFVPGWVRGGNSLQEGQDSRWKLLERNYLALKTWKQLHWKPLNALKIQLLSVMETLWQTSTQGGHFSFPQCETQTTYQMYCFSYYMHSVFLWLSRLYLLWVPTLNWNSFSFPKIILNCFIQNLNIHTPINWVSRIELHSK